MAGAFDEEFLPPPKQDGARFEDASGINVLRPLMRVADELNAQARVISDHDGQIKSFGALIAAVQSSLSAWTNVVAAVGGLIIAALAIAGTVLVYNMQRLDGRTEQLNQRVDAVGRGIDGISREIGALSDAVGRQAGGGTPRR